MKTKISVVIPQGYWGLVKRWLSRMKYANALGYPEPSVLLAEDGAVVYTTASGMGQYGFIPRGPDELMIEFSGRRNSFRGGTPFVGFRWDGPYPGDGWVYVNMKDPFAMPGIAITLRGKVVEYTTSAPGAPFYKVPPEWIHTPAGGEVKQ